MSDLFVEVEAEEKRQRKARAATQPPPVAQDINDMVRQQYAAIKQRVGQLLETPEPTRSYLKLGKKISDADKERFYPIEAVLNSDSELTRILFTDTKLQCTMVEMLLDHGGVMPGIPIYILPPWAVDFLQALYRGEDWITGRDVPAMTSKKALSILDRVVPQKGGLFQ